MSDTSIRPAAEISFSDGLGGYKSRGFHAYDHAAKIAVRAPSVDVVDVGTISFVKTKRNRTHGTQLPPETFQTAWAVIKAAAFVHTIMPQKARRTPLRLIQIVSLYDKSM